jgi:Importin repeat
MNFLLDPLLNVLPPLLTQKESEELTDALTPLIEVATEHPKMFRPCFANLVQFAISVVKEKELENDARQSALELLVTFAEGAPVMCRKDDHYTMATIEQILSLMCDHDDDSNSLEEWRNTDDVSCIKFFTNGSWTLTNLMRIGLLVNKLSTDSQENSAQKQSSHPHSHISLVSLPRQIGVNDTQVSWQYLPSQKVVKST